MPDSATENDALNEHAAPGAPAAGPAAAPQALAERVLLWAVHGCLALVLLTPLVWAPDTFHSFTVGKAVWSRSAIAAAFALWALLALYRPRWRPPPTTILWALAAWLAVAALSAAMGVSPQRSLWSTYTRMEGLVDAAHWVAFFVVLVATLRCDRDWFRLLNASLCVGLGIALIAVARFHAPEAGPFGLLPELRYPRISATTANPTFLGAYLQAVALLAAGFLARSFLPAGGVGNGADTAEKSAGGAKSAMRERRQQRQQRERKERRGRRREPAIAPRRRSRLPERLFWLTALGGAVLGLALSGSMGALAGLGAGAGVAAALFARFGPSRRARRLGLGGLAALGVLGALLAAVLAVRSGPDGEVPPPAFDSILLERVTSTGRIGNTLGGRLRNWEAGVRAFAERPLLGWGTGNYFVGSGRHRERPGKREIPENPELPGADGINGSPEKPRKPTQIRDHAHNMVIEEAATKGLAGLTAYVLLWGATALAVLRGARAGDPRRQALAIFTGAALAGWFVQSQTLFYSPESWLQHMLLLAFAAHLASPGRSSTEPTVAHPPETLRRLAARSSPPLRAVAAAGALALAGGSFLASQAIHEGDAAIRRAEAEGPFLEEMERSMRAFGPLANGPRVILFNNVAANWPVVSAHHPELAGRLVDWTGREAAAALDTEPHSWVIHHALARMYRAMAETRPESAEAAERHFDASFRLAPNLDPMEAPVGDPARRR